MMPQAAPPTRSYNHGTTANTDVRSPRRAPRRAPTDFAAYIKANSVRDTQAHFHVGYDTIRRWASETGLTDFLRGRARDLAANRVPKRPVPHNFGTYAPIETSLALRERYSTTGTTIARWRRETGISSPKDITPPKVRAPKPKKLVHRTIAPGNCFTLLKPVAITIDGSREGDAQRFLQRFYPCYRASILDKRLTGWIVDSRALTTEQMLARAEAKGWKPFSWASLPINPVREE